MTKTDRVPNQASVAWLAVINVAAAGLIASGMLWPFANLGASLTTARPILLLVPAVVVFGAIASLLGSRRAVVASAYGDGLGIAGFGLALVFGFVAPGVGGTSLQTQLWLAAVVVCLAIGLFLATTLDSKTDAA